MPLLVSHRAQYLDKLWNWPHVLAITFGSPSFPRHRRYLLSGYRMCLLINRQWRSVRHGGFSYLGGGVVCRYDNLKLAIYFFPQVPSPSQALLVKVGRAGVFFGGGNASFTDREAVALTYLGRESREDFTANEFKENFCLRLSNLCPRLGTR